MLPGHLTLPESSWEHSLVHAYILRHSVSFSHQTQIYRLHLKIMTARRSLMSSGRMQCVTLLLLKLV